MMTVTVYKMTMMGDASYVLEYRSGGRTISNLKWVNGSIRFKFASCFGWGGCSAAAQLIPPPQPPQHSSSAPRAFDTRGKCGVYTNTQWCYVCE